eukprot:CAMPEP_0180389166 /NCGR_PEP_ID=MMETSP0989-20121125/31250_1 /TAXON_ID=697907 /ORGANISM="non described non described, Strain CCMP2293" /LENGTH=35 /DNA_ID= /DNA_START= /DNA_END= /DNA_ORIENTATION=
MTLLAHSTDHWPARTGSRPLRGATVAGHGRDHSNA